MLRFTIRRALSLIPTIFLIITFAFIIVRVAPGGPFASEKKLSPEIMLNIQKKYHLDESIPRQYVRYLTDFAKGDLGPSFRYKDYTVNQLVAEALPSSMLIGTLAMIMAVVVGIGAGVISALKRNSWVDYSAMGLAVIGLSVPLFVVGPVLQLYLALRHSWLPTSGWLGGRSGYLVLIMPVFTLALPTMAGIARLTRASVLEVLRADYIRTARSKGLAESVVIVKHVLKGALLPVVSYVGPAFAMVITGTVVVESIFAIPGMGRLSIQAAINRDYTVIMGDVIVFSIILVVMNFVVDVCYGFLDPRISYK